MKHVAIALKDSSATYRVVKGEQYPVYNVVEFTVMIRDADNKFVWIHIPYDEFTIVLNVPRNGDVPIPLAEKEVIIVNEVKRVMAKMPHIKVAGNPKVTWMGPNQVSVEVMTVCGVRYEVSGYYDDSTNDVRLVHYVQKYKNGDVSEILHLLD